jgi:UDPglucose--hexose-1-phosphate uridylyltransferase
MTDPRLRHDPVTGMWSVVTPGRSLRPHDGGARGPAPCPFCAGNERLTPPEVEALRPGGDRADGPGWTVRVVPNKFPVFAGGHEVVVHTPQHDAALHELTVAGIEAILDTYRRRLAAHDDAGAAAALVIMNQGAAAGASLAHSHGQVFALPMVPPALVTEQANFALYLKEHSRCLLCDIVERQRSEPSHLVIDGEVVAWTPQASRWPFETWLAPAAHAERFEAAATPALAQALKRVLSALAEVTAGAPLNFWLHTAPFASESPFHWHLEIAPRTTTIAGFELASGVAIDIVDPADAAAQLRAALGAGLGS